MKFGPLEYIVLDNLGAGRMKDDSLNDTQPHECVGKQKYHPVSVLDMAQDEMSDAVKTYGRIDFESKLVCEIWNEAIEAAAELFPYGEWEEINIAAKIRKLKK